MDLQNGQHTREVIVEVWPHHMRRYATRHDLYWMRSMRCPLGVFDVSVHIQSNDDSVVHHLNYLVDGRLFVLRGFTYIFCFVFSLCLFLF